MSKAAEYRRFAAECLEVAQRMSLRHDRERMAGMAATWLELAHKAEETEAPHASAQGSVETRTRESVN
jgi:hypothetical protein